jgi:hypothetical protein
MTALAMAVPRMTRVTWYKHRVSMLGIPAVFLLAALLLFIDGIVQRQWLSSNHLSGCLVQWQGSGDSICAFGSAPRVIAWDRFGNVTRTNVVLLTALAMPAAIGLFAGVPWVAREFESGAFRFTWAQTGSPRRWLLGTFAPLTLLAGASAALFGLALSWWYQVAQWRSGFSPGAGAWQSVESSPLSTVSWTLLAMSLALLAGVAIRRVLPAMIVFVLAIGGCATLSQTLLREHLFRIGQLTRPYSFTVGQWPNPLTTYVTQTWFTTKSGRPVSPDTVFGSLDSYHGSNAGGWLQQHYTEWIGYQPQSHVIWLEVARDGVLVAVAALAVLAAVWWLRRRPAE